MNVSRRALLLGAAAFTLAAGVGAYTFSQSAEAAVETGAAAPNFSVRDANGEMRTLEEFRGRTLILEWTNRGCPYVQKHYNSQNMQNLQRDATAGGAVWLSVISSAEGEQGYLSGAEALAHAQTSGAHPTAILLDASGAMGHAYGARNTPHMFVIDGEGRVVYQGAIDDHPSARPASLEGANNYVRAALADMNAGRAVQVAQTTPYGCSVKYS